MAQVDNRIASGLPGKVRRGPAVCAFLVLLLTFWKQPRPKTPSSRSSSPPSSFLPELALSALAVLLFPWFPATASASLMVLSRVPLVFLAAPASQFKY